MLQWAVGDVTIKRIVESEIVVPYSTKRPMISEASPAALQSMPWLYPHFVTPEGHLTVSFHALLIETPSKRLVVDTCIGNDKPRRILGGQKLQTKFIEALAAAGCKREDVDQVICTHLHVDHVGWNTLLENGRWLPTFPRARYLFGRAEYEFWKQDEGVEQQAIMSDSIAPVFEAGQVDLVEMDQRLSPEIRLAPTPGHTPGHVSVWIESQGQSALITGDTMHHPCQVGRPAWSTSLDTDREAARSMRETLLDEVADRPVLVIGTHFTSPTAGYVKRDGTAFRFEAG